MSTGDAIAFLRALEPEGPWLLVAINPDPTVADPRHTDLAGFAPGDEARLTAWLGGYQGRWNLYFTSNLPESAPFRTAKKEAVRWLRLQHVDVDLPGAADDESLRDELLTNLRAVVPPATAIIFTGGGYQAIWLLERKLDAIEHTPRVEALNTVIWKALGGDPCHDVSRLLRLPGTVNVPNAKKRARGRVPAAAILVEADWTRRYALDRPDPIGFAEERQPLPPRPPPPSNDASGVFADLPVALKKLIRSGDPAEFKNDRSRLGWHVMNALVRRGWTDEDVTKLFLDPTNGVSAHYLEQPSSAVYVARNLKNARERMALDWKRHPRTGDILTKDQANVDRALTALGVKLTHDALADRIWVNGAGPAQRLSDEGVDAIWLRCQSEFGFLPDPIFFRTVFTVRARERSFHPILDYLKRVQPTWNGAHLIGDPAHPSWLTRYGGVEDTPYTRAVGRLTLVAAVRRMRQPGCKFDEMLMLVDPTQGSNKSAAVRTLAVNEDWFNDYLPIGEVGREVIEHVRGFWIVEAQELAGMTTKDVERIKAFCSRQTDRGRMSYDRLVTDLPRSCVFIGTTNEETLFTDLLNRRYWPVSVLDEFDVDAMKRDLDQLWAEAAVAEAAGESIRLDRALWPIAAEVQGRYRVEDSWSTLLDQHLGNLSGRVTSVDLYKIINKQASSVLHTDGRRLGRAMREIGFDRKQFRDGSSPNPRWYYTRGATDQDRDRDILVFRDQITGEVSVTDSAPPSDVEPAPARRVRQPSLDDDVPF